MNETKKKAVLAALNKTDWNYVQTAKLLNMTRQGLHQMAQRYGLIKLRTVRQKRWVRA